MGKNKYEQVGFREMLQIPRKIWENLADTRKMLVWDALGLGSRLKISREYVGRNLPWQSGFDSLSLCFAVLAQKGKWLQLGSPLTKSTPFLTAQKCWIREGKTH